MLEKMLGYNFLTKLRAILLMEADFNYSNKEIFGFRMLEKQESTDKYPRRSTASAAKL